MVKALILFLVAYEVWPGIKLALVWDLGALVVSVGCCMLGLAELHVLWKQRKD